MLWDLTSRNCWVPIYLGMLTAVGGLWEGKSPWPLIGLWR
jgi:hypothetical protein